MALLFKAKWGLKEYNDFSPQRSSLGSSDLSQYSTTDNDFSGFSEKKSL